MRTVLFFLFVITGCNWSHANIYSENTIIPKSGIHRFQVTDTLRIFQDDPAVFKKEQIMVKYPDRYPKPAVRYELMNPKDGAYYLMYNDKKQLMKEGKYTSTYKYAGITYEQGGFYNPKTYFYKKNGNLETIHYQEDGRNFKTEFFDRNKQLVKIKYFNKKTSDTEKIEIYKNGKLKETRIYTAFNAYHTIKADG